MKKKPKKKEESNPLEGREEYKNLHANVLVSRYLIHSYIYYVLDNNVISDYQFDMLARELEARWDEADHPHKSLLTRGRLCSGYDIKDYPSIVKSCAQALIDGELKDSP